MILDRSVVYLTDVFQGRIEYEMIYSLRDAKHRVDLICSYSMRPIMKSVSLYRELLKQKLKTKGFLNY